MIQRKRLTCTFTNGTSCTLRAPRSDTARSSTTITFRPRPPKSGCGGRFRLLNSMLACRRPVFNGWPTRPAGSSGPSPAVAGPHLANTRIGRSVRHGFECRRKNAVYHNLPQNHPPLSENRSFTLHHQATELRMVWAVGRGPRVERPSIGPATQPNQIDALRLVTDTRYATTGRAVVVTNSIC